MTGARRLAALVVGILSLACCSQAVAAKSSISLSSSGALTMGSQVTFNVSTSATSRPFVDLQCYQNGTWVYEQWGGFYAGSLNGQTFTLGPTGLWTSGGANCTADLVSLDNYKPRVLASTSFNVG